MLGARCGVVQKDRLQPPAGVLPWEVLVPLTVVTKEQSLALLPDLPHDPPNLWVEETAYEGRVSSLRVCSWPLPWPIVPFTVLAAHWEVSEQIVELLRGRWGRSGAKKSDFGSCCSLSITASVCTGCEVGWCWFLAKGNEPNSVLRTCLMKSQVLGWGEGAERGMGQTQH